MLSCYNILRVLGKPASVLSDYDDYLLHSEFDIDDSSSGHNKSDKLLRSDADTKSIGGDSILEEEEREEGSVQLNVYLSYLRAIGYLLSGAILLSMFLMQSSRNMTDWWLSFWVSTEWHKKMELLKNPTKIEEIQEKYLLTEIEPLQLAF